MTFAHLFGRKMLVDHRLINHLRVQSAQTAGGTAITISGSIMESAKVFDSVQIEQRPETILVTVYAALVIWKRRGSPDFQVTSVLQLPPGGYDVRYAGANGVTVFLDRVEVGA